MIELACGILALILTVIALILAGWLGTRGVTMINPYEDHDPYEQEDPYEDQTR